METIFHSLTPDEFKDLISTAVLEVVEKINPQQQQQEKKDELLRINDLVILLKVSKVTIHNWKKSGLLPFHRMSNKIYFKKNEVIESLQKANNKRSITN